MANQCMRWVTVQMLWGCVELQEQGPSPAAPTLPTLFLLLSRSRGKDGQVQAAEKKNPECIRKTIFASTRSTNNGMMRLGDIWWSSVVEFRKSAQPRCLNWPLPYGDSGGTMTDNLPPRNLPPPCIALQSPFRDAADPLYKSPPNFTHLLAVSICQAHSPVQPVMKNPHYSPPPNRYAGR